MSNITFDFPALNASSKATPPSNLGINLWYAVVCWIQALLSLLGHSLPLFAYAQDETLRTAFGCYVINILLADLVIILFEALMALQFSIGWHTVGWLCPLIEPLYLLGASVAIWTQVFLVISRTCAMFSPYRFRQWHTKKAVTRLCLVLWTVALLYMTSLVAMTFPLYTKYKIPGCVGVSAFLQPTLTYHKIISLKMSIPTWLIIFIFPLLQWKNSALIKSRKDLLARNLKLSQTKNFSEPKPDKINVAPTCATSNSTKSEASRSEKAATQKSINFWILRWIFIVVVVFWTPITIYHFVLGVSGISNDSKRSRVVDFYLLIWALTHVTLEPIMLILTIRPLRSQIRHMLSSSISPYAF